MFPCHLGVCIPILQNSPRRHNRYHTFSPTSDWLSFIHWLAYCQLECKQISKTTISLFVRNVMLRLHTPLCPGHEEIRPKRESKEGRRMHTFSSDRTRKRESCSAQLLERALHNAKPILTLRRLEGKQPFPPPLRTCNRGTLLSRKGMQWMAIHSRWYMQCK